MPSSDNNIAELLIALKADVAGLKATLDQSKKEAKTFLDGLKDDFGAAGAAFAEIFAVKKIIEFSAEAEREYAEIARDTEILASQTGKSWSKYREQVENTVHAVAELTGETDNSLVQALQRAQLMTGNMAINLKLMNDAARLSLITHRSTSEELNTLVLAYQGNQRGLMMLARELGLAGDSAQDATQVFDALYKGLKKVGDVSDDTKSKNNKLKIVWEEMKEAVGELVSFSMPLWLFLERVVVSVIDAIVFAVKMPIRAFQTIVAQAAATLTFLQEVKVKGFKQAMIDTWDAMKEAAKKSNQTIKEDTSKLLENLEKTWDVGLKKVKKLGDQAVKDHAAQEQAKALAAEKEAEREAAAKKKLEDYKKQIAHAEEEYEKSLYRDLTHFVSEASQEMANDLSKGAQEALGKDLLRSIVNAIAGALDAWAAYYSTLAIADAATGSEAKSYMDLAASVAIEIGAGTVRGMGAAFLAEGGLVTRPTLAVVGEAGPEAVIPLNRAGGMLGGMNINGGITLSFPGVSRASDFNSAQSQRAARSLLMHLDQTARMRGARQSS